MTPPFTNWADAHNQKDDDILDSMVKGLEKRGFVFTPDKEMVLLKPDGTVATDEARRWIEAHPEWKKPASSS